MLAHQLFVGTVAIDGDETLIHKGDRDEVPVDHLAGEHFEQLERRGAARDGQGGLSPFSDGGIQLVRNGFRQCLRQFRSAGKIVPFNAHSIPFQSRNQSGFNRIKS